MIGDGFKLDATYNELVKKCVKKVVAEELRKFQKKVLKNCVTRWNSILFMVRSINNISEVEYAKLVSLLNEKKYNRADFKLSKLERIYLAELQKILESFEFVTDEFQSDGVTSSKVFPLVTWLTKKLNENFEQSKHTQSFKRVLLDKIEERFGEYIKSDLFKLSAVLDPRFGISVFKLEDRVNVTERLKSNLSNLDKIVGDEINAEPKTTLISQNETKKFQKEALRDATYKSLKYLAKESTSSASVSLIDDMIQNYYSEILASTFECEDPLEFWKRNELKYPKLAALAKKFLGVPASSASAERMFSIAGHIFSVKRRRMGIKLFERLVFLKLNEEFM